MCGLHTHKLQFSLSFFENNSSCDIIGCINHEVFIDIWRLTVGKNYFNGIAAIFNLAYLDVCLRLGILANAI